jgi:hypothetical protein
MFAVFDTRISSETQNLRAGSMKAKDKFTTSESILLSEYSTPVACNCTGKINVESKLIEIVPVRWERELSIK